MMTDPIADFLTCVRNASKAKLRKVDVRPSQLKLAIADLWKKDGFIRNYKLYREDEKDTAGILRLYLKYVGKNQPIIHGVRRISRPSRRVYTKSDKTPKVMGGIGMAVLSTSKGVMSDQMARENKVGGEVICTIW
jgi:small subunit ribosomal protein S8